MQVYGEKSNRWRDAWNPLRGLTMGRVVSLLEAGERGQYADLQWFYHYMERSEPMIHAVNQRRRAALLSCDWTIRHVNEADPQLAEEQAFVLQGAYDQMENFRDAVAFLCSGIFRGFAHLEKHLAQDGALLRLEPVEQWFWVRDGLYGAWEYNENAVSGRWRGVPIDTESFVVFESVPLNRMLAGLFLKKNLNERDWDSYLENLGIPSVFLIGPPNTSAEKEKEYQAIAEAIIAGGRGYLPYGSDIKYVDGGGAKPLHLQRIEYIDKQIALVGTGGLLTMLAESGTGTLAGNAHRETFREIARGDAALLSEVFQRQVDLPILQQAFPGEDVCAYFEFAEPSAIDSSRVIEDAVALAKVGVRIELGELSEKTGYTLVEAGAE